MRSLRVANQSVAMEFHNPDAKRNRVILIYPHLQDAAFKTQLQDRESLALGYLGAALRKFGYPARQINAERLMLPPDEVVRRVLNEPDVLLVGISAGSQRSYLATKAIAAGIRKARPELPICVGGIFPTAADVEVIEDCRDIDIVVKGEGELALVELAWRLATGRTLAEMHGVTLRAPDASATQTPGRERLSDLDVIGFPTRIDIAEELAAGRPVRSAKLVASRGCYARCTFCSIHQIYGDHLVARRSPENVVAEMESIAAEFGIRQFAFMDDLFITPSQRGYEWVDRFCEVLIAKDQKFRFWLETRADTVTVERITKLVEAGMYGIFLGIESGVDSVLERWDKGITSRQNMEALDRLKEVAGLKADDIRIGYIMFDREMTFEELKLNYRWLRASGNAMVHNLQNKLNVYWGTPAYKAMLANGLKDPSTFGDRWRYEISDARVNQFEKALRRFLERTHARYFDELVPAKKAHITKRYGARNDAVPWIGDVMSQALRGLEQIERATWYFMFDAFLEQLEETGDLPSDYEEAVWNALADANAEIVEQSRNLVRLADAQGNLSVLDAPPVVSPSETSVCWLSEEGRVGNIWLANSNVGFSAILGVRGRDYYDHAFTPVSFTITNGAAVSTSLRVVRIEDHEIRPPSWAGRAASPRATYEGSGDSP